MTKTEAIAVLNTAVDCYIEDCISTSPKGEITEVWQAFNIVRDVLERSIAQEGVES
jgi:malate synthase